MAGKRRVVSPVRERLDSETQQFGGLFSNVNRLAIIVKLHVRVMSHISSHVVLP